jgi:hypothetical protein
VKLSKTIAELTNRCRQLEDALRTLQAKHYNEPHPLLDNSLLTTPQTDHFASPIEGSNHEDQEEVDSVQDTLGTLTIDCFGNSNFLGRTAGMHVSVLFTFTTNNFYFSSLFLFLCHHQF